MGHVLHSYPNLDEMCPGQGFAGEKANSSESFKDHIEEQVAFDIPWRGYLRLLDENNKNYKEKPAMDEYLKKYGGTLPPKNFQLDDELFNFNDSCFDIFPEIEDLSYKKETLPHRWNIVWSRVHLSFINALEQISSRYN